MKDWRRSPEPPGMMGVKEPAYQVQGNWGQPEDLFDSQFDPASPLPHTTPTVFLTDDGRTSRNHPRVSAVSRTAGLSLYSMCLRVILRNISSVQDLGDMPYRNAKPILEECRIDQLISLEEASPHLLEHSEEIWRRNCLRDFLELRKKYTPPTSAKEPKSWRKLYFRTKGEIEQAKSEAAQRIKDKYAQHRAEKDAKKLVVSDRPLMLKAARSGGRRFCSIFAGGGGGASASKGQSLMNKARSGSAAQAKLTAPRNARFGGMYKSQGRSKMVGAEIAPEAAGVVSSSASQMTRPMVAPKRITAGASEGLAKMKEFSRPLPGSDASAEESQPTSAARKTATASNGTDPNHCQKGRQFQDTATATEITSSSNTGLPRLKPHQVAAAPPLTSYPSPSSSARSRLNNGGGSASSRSAEASSRKPAPLSPPPDVARTERRKLNFFGSSKPHPSSSATTATATAEANRSSSRGGSPSSPITLSTGDGVEVRGMKRAHSSSGSGNIANPIASASGSRTRYGNGATSPPSASSPTATSFFSSSSSSSATNRAGVVRVVQAKRAHTEPHPHPPPSSSTSSTTAATISASSPISSTLTRNSSNTTAPQNRPNIVAAEGVGANSSSSSGGGGGGGGVGGYNGSRPSANRQHSHGYTGGNGSGHDGRSLNGVGAFSRDERGGGVRASPAALSSVFAPSSSSSRSSPTKHR